MESALTESALTESALTSDLEFVAQIANVTMFFMAV